MYIMRKENGKLKAEALRPTLFVPMTGNAEDNRQVKPDPLNPQLFNSDFELVKKDYEFILGWYYQRQVKLISGNDAAQGSHYASFNNSTPGLSSHMLQGFAIDGRSIGIWPFQHRLSLMTSDRGEHAMRFLFAISFYDDSRREVGGHTWAYRNTTGARGRLFVCLSRQGKQSSGLLFGSVGDLDRRP